MSNKETYINILEQINLLDEYQKKSLAIILMQLTLNYYQNDINFKQYKQSIK
jgi:hypothetical protein